jgi:hypothetical protein
MTAGLVGRDEEGSRSVGAETCSGKELLQDGEEGGTSGNVQDTSWI